MSNYVKKDNNEFPAIDGVRTSDTLKHFFDYDYLRYKPCFSKTQDEIYLEQIVIPAVTATAYIEFSSPSSFTLSSYRKSWDGTLEYSTDKNNWQEWDGETTLSSVGNVLYLRGSNNTEIVDFFPEDWYGNRFRLEGSDISCSGNIESILDYSTVKNGGHPEMANYCFTELFKDNESLISVPELHATTLTDYCYSGMFDGCTSLSTAPELPAMTLAPSCYQAMFNGCISLTNAPALPATTLAVNCYSNMFNGCVSLTEAPVLPAMTLAIDCYSNMFSGCASLTEAPELPATSLVDSCYFSMFRYCTSLTTAPELPVVTLANSCYSYMFENCTSLTEAPELPATTLGSSCYSNMFSNCTSLVTPPELPATTLAGWCYYQMFQGCTSLATPPELPATSLASYCYYNMFNNCTSIKLSTTQTTQYTDEYRIPSTGTGVTANNALTNMFTGTGGTFTGTPIINITYYIQLPPKPYLTFSSDDPFTLGVSSKNWDGTVECSTDKSTWSTWDGSTALSSNNENELYLRGIGNTTFYQNDSATSFILTSSANSGIHCNGSIESLLDYETVIAGEHPQMGDNCFEEMFYSCTSLASAPDLTAITLSVRCYASMFSLCTSLVTPPLISAVTLANYCCNVMFKGCTSLASAPALPATTLAEGCYAGMFNGCTSLTTATELPAAILAARCYQSMFLNCTSLTIPPSLSALTLTYWCYSSMFSGCTAIKLSETQTSEYTTPYRIPVEGTGADGTNALLDMFTSTGGTFTGTPTINTTYYIAPAS